MSEPIAQDALTETALQIILRAGDARRNVHDALAYVEQFSFDEAAAALREASACLTLAHSVQTDVIQDEADGCTIPYSLLFTHAQDTLMTVASELQLAERMLAIFRRFYQAFSHGGTERHSQTAEGNLI